MTNFTRSLLIFSTHSSNYCSPSSIFPRQLLGCLSDINAPALRTLPNYNIFNKSHLIGLHPFREDFKRRTDASIRTDLMAMMDPRFRCCEATHLLQQLLFLDPILRTSCRVALETSTFLKCPGSLPPGGLVDEWVVSC